MRIRHLLATAAVAAMTLGVAAGPASADHTKGKKYLDVELTREAAIEAGDSFGVAPEGTSGEGALYLNAGQDRFCVDLDFEVPEGVTFAAIHLHEKAPGSQSGPVVVQLSGTIDGDTADGCADADREFLRGVLTSPDEYYVNAHFVGEGIEAGELPVVRTEIGRN